MKKGRGSHPAETPFIFAMLIFLAASSITGIHGISAVRGEGVGEILYVGGTGPGNFSTIAEALAEAQAGDTIHIYGGEYGETLEVTKNITLKGEGTNTTWIVGDGDRTVVTIGAEGVTIEGLTITGSGSFLNYSAALLITGEGVTATRLRITNNTGFGIYLQGASDITIDNSTIEKCQDGILVKSSSNITIKDSTLIGNDGGLAVYSSSRLTVKGNTILNNSYALESSGISSLRLEGNDIKNNTYTGIYVLGGKDLGIMANFIENHYTGMYLMECSNITIETNTMMNSSCHISLYESDNTTIKGNNITTTLEWMKENESEWPWVRNPDESRITAAIDIQNSWNTTVENNTLHRAAIFLWPAKTDALSLLLSQNIENNTLNGRPIYFRKNACGEHVPEDVAQIILLNCTDMVIEDREKDPVIGGISLLFSHRCRIERTRVTSPNNGILIMYGRDNVIRDNNISYVGWAGVQMDGAVGNLVENNTIYNCSFYGISLGRTSEANGIRNNSIKGPHLFSGVSISDGSRGNILEENTIIGSGNCGVEIYGAEDNIIRNNTLMGTPTEGIIDIYLSKNASISGNLILGRESPQTFYWTSNQRPTGVNAKYSSGLTIYLNTLENLTRAVAFNSTTNAVINGNLIRDCDEGVNLTDSEDNFIFNNLFLNTTTPASSNTTENTWNLPYPLGGNYWDIHTPETGTASDVLSGPLQNTSGSDGICDTPYTHGGVADLYPLAHPPSPGGEGDRDGDMMPDAWETEHGLNPEDPRDGILDADGDGLTNAGEYAAGANPGNPDTDGDGMPDGWEYLYLMSPTDPENREGDPDGDNLTNIQEYENDTDPFKADTDGDGMPDGWEAENGLSPARPDGGKDRDRDGYTNLQEYENDTDPNDPHSRPLGNINVTGSDAWVFYAIIAAGVVLITLSLWIYSRSESRTGGEALGSKGERERPEGEAEEKG
ncbi:MAG: right-handed parallel beta-helix repeat-containing protein, partial [Thermoplasmata archaeon]|nr:right-handed parallel beta-helix repeat-containing protein [Thermoplasmata archaeon]